MALALALVACGETPEPPPPDVLWVIVDSLRPDALRPEVAPTLSELSRRGARFDAAYATAPWAAPSVASMLTGELPREHGLDDLSGTLADSARTLAEQFEAAGWRTFAVVSDFQLGNQRGFGQGFGHLAMRQPPEPYASSTAGVIDEARDWLGRAAADDRPLFLMVHLSDARPGFIDHSPERTELTPLDGTESAELLELMAPDLEPAEWDQVRALYEGEVRHVDAGLARLLARLGELGRRERTLVVVTASHGVALGEHGAAGSARSLHDEMLRVPWILNGPGVPAGRVLTEPVSLTSLAATVAGLVLTPTPGAPVDPRSLASVVRGPSLPPEAPVFFEVDLDPLGGTSTAVHLVGVRSGDFKLIRDVANGRDRLYDLVADPGELRDLLETRPGPARQLGALLDRTFGPR